MTVNGVSGDIIPKKGQSTQYLRDKYTAAGKDVAIIDSNNDGKYNYGKTEGDTIKIFDWDNKKAQGYHLVKPGEKSAYADAKAGQIDKSTADLGMSLHKTFAGKSIDDIKKMYPKAELVAPKGGNKFTKGSTLMLTEADGTRHNLYMPNDGDSVKEIWKMLSGQSKESIPYETTHRLGETLYWYDVKSKK